MSDDCSRIRLLITQARAGDDRARDDLFRACRNYMAVVARTQVESWLRVKVDASDIVQQSLMDAHRGFPGFDGHNEGEWLAWLKQIVTHNTQDMVRKYRTAKRAAGREADNQLDSQGFSLLDALPQDVPSPSQVLMAYERELQLADALSQLSEDHQEVIHLRSLQKLPFEEVAQRMGRTRPATQMLWMRAVQKLESLLTAANQP